MPDYVPADSETRIGLKVGAQEPARPCVDVLVVTDHFLPGYRAGGTIRALANMIRALPAGVRCRVLTRDHDLGEPTQYAGVRPDSWQDCDGTPVFYAGPRALTLRGLRAAVRAAAPDVLYLNSFFSRISIRLLLLRRFALLPAAVVLAPRGEFSAGALRLNPLRKRIYIWAARALGLCRGVYWQASSDHEAADIRREFGDPVELTVTAELISASPETPRARRGEKEPGALDLVFVGRVAPVKNLEGALNALRGAAGRIRLAVYGPIEDKAYWARCTRVIAELPRDVAVRYAGPLQSDAVASVFAEADALLLPSRGENFGHVIAEALAAGCPAVISDRTPWRGLRESQAGWDLPLADVSGFRQAIQTLVEMGPDEHRVWSDGARHYLHARVDPALPGRYADLFARAATHAPRSRDRPQRFGGVGARSITEIPT
jgi:glycosyltransferase involved in cell wall biosynthesis